MVPGARPPSTRLLCLLLLNTRLPGADPEPRCPLAPPRPRLIALFRGCRGSRLPPELIASEYLNI
jgi:hypothetical protein